jgi:hypothetical protein
MQIQLLLSVFPGRLKKVINIMKSDSGAWGIKWLQTKLSISSNKKQKEPKAIHGRSLE